MADTTPSRPAARRLPRDQRVATIMLTARAVFRERGSEQFLTSEVAERCGISEGTIYKYFPTKRDLLIQVAESWFEEIITNEPQSSPERPVRDRLLHAVVESLSIIRRERALTRFILMDLRADANYRSMRLYELNKQFSARMMNVVEEGIKRGELRSDIPPKIVRDIIFGCIEHQTWAYLRGEGDFSVEESAAGITDVVYRGTATHPSRPGGEIGAAIDRLEGVTAALHEELKHITKRT